MRSRSRRPVFVAALVLLALFSSGIVQASPQAQPPSAAIRLKAATLIPGVGQATRIPAGLAGAERAGQRGYYLVQFRGPVMQAWKDQAGAAGAELLEYLPDFAFKARMTPAAARQVAALADVSWVGLFEPAYKLSPSLDRSGSKLTEVRVEQGASASAAAGAVAASGATVLAVEGQRLLVAASSAQLDVIAHVADVAWVSTFVMPEKHDEYARAIIGANAANAAYVGAPAARGYDGSSQTAAVADTGFFGGTGASAPADFSYASDATLPPGASIGGSRVVGIFNWPGVTDSCFQTITNDGAIDVDSGHGTHVAGSVLSNGSSSPNGRGRGIAPAARLVFQATENYVVTTNFCKLAGLPNGYYLTGLPADLRTLFQQAYDAGARIHANSWGSASAGDYTDNSVAADDFIWNHRDMTITFSAGNEGADANADGVVDNDSIGSPATAKNVITIGASENNRAGNYQCDLALTYTSRDTTYQNGQTCTSMGGINLLGTPRQRWGFTANPVADDPTAGNSNQMAAFSSRGPTDDTRIKPDVVAPGTWILSTYSNRHREGYGDPTNPQNGAYQLDGWGMPINGAYKYFGGTSMSNPIAAGAATVVRDFYQKSATVNASAALVKATLINSAVDLLDENNDGLNDNDFPIPNVHEGWGLINLDNATDGTAKYIDNTSGTTTGTATTYTANVATAGSPLKISLVWSDFASTAAASINLVNDLDLEVTAPNGTTVYRGNSFTGGWSNTNATADRRNNVENVYIQAASAGTYSITVRGFNVPNGPQPYALVVDGAATLTAPAAPISTGLQSPSAQAAVTSSSGDNNGYQTNPTNALANDGVFAVDTNSGNGNSTSCTSTAKDRHVFSNYNITLAPSASSIAGVEVRLDARADSANGAPKICVELSWNGGTSWTAVKNTTNLTTSEATYTLGNASDTWGRTWAAGDFTNGNFRVRVTNVSSSTSRDFSLDWVAVNVHYLP